MALVPLRRAAAAIRNARLSAGVLLCGALLQGCALVVPQSTALHEAWPGGLPDRVELTQVPFFPQEEFQCGPASLAEAISTAGVRVTPRDVAPQVYLPSRQGSLQVEMMAAPRRYGLVSYALDGKLESVLREIAAGHPVIVLQDFGVWPLKIWHYAVAIGFDRARPDVVLRSGLHERQVAPIAALEYTWTGSERWAMVVLPPERIPVTADRDRYVDAVVAMARVAPPARAKVAYEAVLERWPGTFAAEVGLGNALQSLGDLHGSEAQLRAALAQQPDSVPVLNNLALVVARQGRVDDGLALIARAERNAGPYAAAVADTRATIESLAKN